MTPAVLELERDGIPACAAAAAKVLRAGGIVFAPTDTIYGLLLRYSDRQAVERLYTLKGRGAEKRLLALVPDTHTAAALAAVPLPAFAERLWPGPLTLAFPVVGSHPLGWETQAVRVPASPWLAALLAAVGEPLYAPSANPQGHAPARTPEEGWAMFGGGVDLYIGTSVAGDGLPSTLVVWKNDGWRMLREGAIAADQLQEGLM